MKELILTKVDGRLGGVMQEEMARVSLEKAKLFRTTVHDLDDASQVAHFITTSKDIHLELGQMSIAGQWALYQIIDRVCGPGVDGVMLYGSEDSRVAFYATVHLSDPPTIHLSRANR